MSKFKKAIKKKALASALAKHPLRELDEQVKKDYVKGMVFIAVEDENFSDEEKEYIKSLMQNIGLEESLLDELEAFANEPGEDEIHEFMERIQAFDENIKINFLIEVIVIAFKDGEFDESEQEMFDDYLEMFELTQKKDIIMYMALALVDKDIDLALSLYIADKEFFNRYDYMFDMVDIDIEKELNNVFDWEWTTWTTGSYGSIRKNRLVSLFTENVQRVTICINSNIISKSLERRVGTNQYYVNNNKVLDDGFITNIALDKDLYSYSCDTNEPVIFANTSMSKFINFYISWLNNNIANDIARMEVHLSYSSSSASGDEKIGFNIDCAGQPVDGLYEMCFGSFSSKRERDTNFVNNVFYEKGNFGGSANDCTKNASPSEFTFRLMKVEE
jgi:uncharacterized tellurite resistance protein B-like protein